MSAVAQGHLHPGLPEPNPPSSQPPLRTRIHQRPRHRLLARRNPSRLRLIRTSIRIPGG
jgi:hypothetical protein